MAVDANHVPPERVQLAVDVPERADIGHMAVYLQVVEVENHREVVEALMSGEHESLPVGALLHLAVATEHVGLRGQGASPRGAHAQPERAARGHGESLAETARADLDAGTGMAVRVALQPAAKLTKREKVIVREPAELVVRRVQHGRSVPLGEEESVSAVVVGVVAVEVHHTREEQRGHGVRSRERSSRMSRLASLEHVDDVVAHGIGDETNGARVNQVQHKAPPFSAMGRLGRGPGARDGHSL